MSARFPVPSYQLKARLPMHIRTGKSGRGIPDIAGNASVNSGYRIYTSGRLLLPTTGGTSAVAPLFAGLIARINSNLSYRVGFINPMLYRLPAAAFRRIKGPPGPSNNSFNGVKGYRTRSGWDACTGLGSVKGTCLQTGLEAAYTRTR